MKKALSLLLSLMFILTMLPLGAIPVAAATSGTTGDCTWTLDDSGHLTISGKGKMGDYSCETVYRTTAPWGSSVNSVTIEDGVTTVGDYAFYNCYSLASVTIPDSVTTIGKYAFYICDLISSVTIPDSVTTIGEYAFYGCDALANIYYGGTMDQTLAITIGTGNTGLNNAQWHFSDGSTGRMGTTGDCTWALDANGHLTISGNGPMGDYDPYDEPIAPWGWKIISVTIEDGVTAIGNAAFFDCDSLTSVTIPDSVTTIGPYAFAYCDALANIYYGGTTEQVIAIRIGTYNYDLTIATWHFSDGFTGLCGTTGDCTWTRDANGHLTISGNGPMGDYDPYDEPIAPWGWKIISVTIEDGVTAIGNAAFFDCASLVSVTIPDSVTTIGDSAFSYCTSLTSVTIPDGVTTIGQYAFSYCTSLTDVYYGGSEADRAAISIDNRNNNPLLNATWHYAKCDHIYTNACDVDCNVCGAEREVPHVYAGVCDRDCNECGVEREPAVDHVYDSYRDVVCNRCNHIRELPNPPGDSDGDGAVNVRDVAVLQQYLAGWDRTLAGATADANGDGSITIRDVALLQQYLAGWDVELALPQ